MSFPKRNSKFNAVKTLVGDKKFDSKREAKRYGELAFMLGAGLISDLELQKRFDLIVNGVKVCTYVSDFCYAEKGKPGVVVEDSKGFRTPEYKLKKKLMVACHGIEIREV